MGLLDTLRKARDVVSSRSLETQAKITTTAQQSVAIPEQTTQAMREQGMSEGGAFSPGTPIDPYQPIGTDPIITPYQVGQNIFAVPRGLSGVGFDALRNITSRWDLARLCIEVRLDELRGLDWEIVVEDGVDADKYESELKAARQFFEHPSPGHDFDDLQMMAGEDWLRYDALCIARRRLRNGKLGALEAIDGTSIAPLIDGRGAMPTGSAPAYVQWSWGLPWVWLTERDVIYKPHHPRPETRYGLPPAEWVLLLANTDVRLQWYYLTYFTQGEIPEAFVNAPPDVQDSKQVEALQNAYSAVMSGAKAAHHKVKWIPAGANVHTINKATFDMGLSGFMVAKGCAAYKVQPAEIGFTEKVNKSSGDTQEAVTYRRAIKPTVMYFQSIWNKILREDLNMPYARFKYLNIEEEEDQLKLAQTRAVYIEKAVLSPDEVRQELGYDIDPAAPVGRSFAMRTGVIFVDEKSQQYARKQGNLAQQYAMDGAQPVQPGDDPNNDQAKSDDENGLLSPEQALADPVVKPVPIKPAQSGQITTPAKSTQDELRKWRNAAVKRAKDGKMQKVWEPRDIDILLAKSINAQLASATDAEDVRAVFAPLIGGDAPANFTKRATKIKRGKGKLVARDEEKLRKQTDAMKVKLEAFLKQEGESVAKHVISQIQTDDSLTIQIEATRQPTTATTAIDMTVLEAALASYGWQGWDKHLKESVSEHIRKIYAQAAEEGIKTLGLEPSFDLINPLAVEYAEKRGAELVGKKLIDGEWVDNPNPEYAITDATRRMVQRHVVSAIKNGASIPDLQKSIQECDAFSESRAETIARTETGFAYNGGSAAGFRQAKVQHVEVFDGDDDPECAEADGSIWTVEYAERHLLEHPNCTRSLGPVPPDEDPDYIEDAPEQPSTE